MRVALSRWFADMRHLLGGVVLDVAGLGLVLLTAVAVPVAVVPRLGPDLLLRVVRELQLLADEEHLVLDADEERLSLPESGHAPSAAAAASRPVTSAAARPLE